MLKHDAAGGAWMDGVIDQLERDYGAGPRTRAMRQQLRVAARDVARTSTRARLRKIQGNVAVTIMQVRFDDHGQLHDFLYVGRPAV